MSEHTPGPWVWAQYERAGGIYLCTPNRGQLIVMDFVRQGMQCGQPRFAIWEGEERGRMGGIMKPAETLNLDEHPDAVLIKAAPDLLAALEGLVAKMDEVALDPNLGDESDRVFPHHEFDEARAAIAKAKANRCLSTDAGPR